MLNLVMLITVCTSIHDDSYLMLSEIFTAGCMLNGRPVGRGECISSRASGTPVTTSPAGE